MVLKKPLLYGAQITRENQQGRKKITVRQHKPREMRRGENQRRGFNSQFWDEELRRGNVELKLARKENVELEKIFSFSEPKKNIPFTAQARSGRADGRRRRARVIYIFGMAHSVHKSGYPKGTPLEVISHIYKHY